MCNIHYTILYAVGFTLLIVLTAFEMSDAVYDAAKDRVSVKTICIAFGSAAALGTLIMIYRNTRKKGELPEDDLESGVIQKEVHKLRSDLDMLKAEVDDLREQMRKGRTVSFTRASGEYGSKSCLKTRVLSRQSLMSEDEYYTSADEEWGRDSPSPTTSAGAARPNGGIPQQNGQQVPQHPGARNEAFITVDRMFEELKDAQQQYDMMYKMYKADPDNVEALWRLSRSCQQVAAGIDKKDPARKEKIIEGRGYGQRAAELEPSNFEAVRWAAVLTGTATDYLPTKERIEQGNVFKEYLDRALAMQPSDFTVLHMRGRFRFQISQLTWMEKKIASTFFGELPSATIEEAIEDFIEADKVKPGWPENLLWLGKSYMVKKDKSNAAAILGECCQLTAKDDGERVYIQEAREMSVKCR